MGLFSGLIRSVVPKVFGGLFRSGARSFGSVAVDKAKEMALNMAKQKAAQIAADSAKQVADKTGLTGLVGQDLVNQGASALGGIAGNKTADYFQNK